MIRHSFSDAPRLFRLFVYGTLKRGYWNHETYCGSAVSVEEATVRGRLHGLPSGIPVLEVPDEDILAVGTDDPVADARMQESIIVPDASHDQPGWHTIHGEIITFSNPGLCVPPIDRLESFRPNRFSLYVRVLLAVAVSSGLVASWCYIGSNQHVLSAVPLKSLSWHPRGG